MSNNKMEIQIPLSQAPYKKDQIQIDTNSVVNQNELIYNTKQNHLNNIKQNNLDDLVEQIGSNDHLQNEIIQLNAALQLNFPIQYKEQVNHLQNIVQDRQQVQPIVISDHENQKIDQQNQVQLTQFYDSFKKIFHIGNFQDEQQKFNYQLKHLESQQDRSLLSDHNHFLKSQDSSIRKQVEYSEIMVEKDYGDSDLIQSLIIQSGHIQGSRSTISYGLNSSLFSSSANQKYQKLSNRLELLEKHTSRLNSQHTSLIVLLQNANIIHSNMLNAFQTTDRLKRQLEELKINKFVQQKRIQARFQIAYQQFYSQFQKFGTHIFADQAKIIKQMENIIQKNTRNIEYLSIFITKQHRNKQNRNTQNNYNIQKIITLDSPASYEKHWIDLQGIRTQFEQKIESAKLYTKRFLQSIRSNVSNDFNEHFVPLINQSYLINENKINEITSQIKAKLGELYCVAEYELYLQKQSHLSAEIKKIANNKSTNDLSPDSSMQKMATLQLNFLKQQQKHILMETVDRLGYETISIDEKLVRLVQSWKNKQKSNKKQISNSIKYQINQLDQQLFNLNFQLRGLSKYLIKSNKKQQTICKSLSTTNTNDNKLNNINTNKQTNMNLNKQTNMNLNKQRDQFLLSMQQLKNKINVLDANLQLFNSKIQQN